MSRVAVPPVCGCHGLSKEVEQQRDCGGKLLETWDDRQGCGDVAPGQRHGVHHGDRGARRLRERGAATTSRAVAASKKDVPLAACRGSVASSCTPATDMGSSKSHIFCAAARATVRWQVNRKVACFWRGA